VRTKRFFRRAVVLGALLAGGMSGPATAQPNDWENPQRTHLNRLPARATLPAYARTEAARAGGESTGEEGVERFERVLLVLLELHGHTRAEIS